MKINSAVVFVGLGVESHEASFGNGFRQSRAYPKGVRPREALHSIQLIPADEPLKRNIDQGRVKDFVCGEQLWGLGIQVGKLTG
jgi:hypothetical protein